VSQEIVHCVHAERCGGCDFLGVPYDEQLARKGARLLAALGPYPVLGDVCPGAARGADPLVGYRTRLKWMAGPRGTLGLFGRGGHEVVDTPECRVASPALARVADTLRALAREPRFARVAASLRAVDLRETLASGAGAPGGDGEEDAHGAVVTLVLVREERPPRRELESFAEALRAARPEASGIFVNWAAKRAIQVLGPDTETLAGAASVLDQQGDVAVTASPGAFVQAHRGQAAAVAREMVSGIATLGRRPRVLELFAGASPFGLALARAGCDVTSIESFAPAAAGAAAAAAAQGLVLHALAGDAEAQTERLARAGERFDAIVVDPPRRGLSPRLRRAIASLAPRKLVYLACDPDTLARDLADLAWRGLRVAAVDPWDFVPLTEHVEALAWLAPGAPPPLTVLARTRSPEGATTRVVDAPPHLAPGELLAAIAALDALPAALPDALADALPDAGGPAGTEGVRATRERPRGLVSTLPAGGSGALVAGAPLGLGGAVLLAAVRGSPRTTLRGIDGQLEVLAAGPARALVALTLADARAIGAVVDALGRAGHPVLGDPRDAPTARHVLEKHGVDRPLVHVAAIDVEGLGRVTAPRAGDLAAALTRLGLDA